MIRRRKTTASGKGVAEEIRERRNINTCTMSNLSWQGPGSPAVRCSKTLEEYCVLNSAQAPVSQSAAPKCVFRLCRINCHSEAILYFAFLRQSESSHNTPQSSGSNFGPKSWRASASKVGATGFAAVQPRDTIQYNTHNTIDDGPRSFRGHTTAPFPSPSHS